MGDPISVSVRDSLNTNVETSRKILGLRRCTWIWLILVGLTAVSFSIGELGRSGAGFMALLLTIAVIKGQLISDFFMGLRRARLMWRAVMLGYLAIISGGIATAYLIGMN